jgi:hypothetical protein
MNISLHYGDAGRGEFRERPASWQELEQRLAEIAKEYRLVLNMPYSVDLEGDNGRLSVGLGDKDWILFYYPADDTKPVLNSFGDEKATGTSVFYFGQWTELSNKYLIPRSKAIEAIKLWCEAGILSSDIKWTSEIFWV